MGILDAIGLAIGTGGLALIIALIVVVSGFVATIEAICGVFKRRHKPSSKDEGRCWCPKCNKQVHYRQNRRVMKDNACVEFDATCPDCGTTLSTWTYPLEPTLTEER